ncbi:hypothetical protein AVEN_202162-1 [Araneus ventricosus]|uniref:Uncharacterized protein n=1 Tax=Araneus ventricosus TaxID=182803 RepID=A0A4Y2QB86_ARAVE|nr:hypothetical protein AVEN_202162-1 [Araneus ventricosus]
MKLPPQRNTFNLNQSPYSSTRKPIQFQSSVLSIFETKNKKLKLGEVHAKIFENPKRMDCCPKQQRNHQQREPSRLIPIPVTFNPTGNS